MKIKTEIPSFFLMLGLIAMCIIINSFITSYEVIADEAASYHHTTALEMANLNAYTPFVKFICVVLFMLVINVKKANYASQLVILVMISTMLIACRSSLHDYFLRLASSAENSEIRKELYKQGWKYTKIIQIVVACIEVPLSLMVSFGLLKMFPKVESRGFFAAFSFFIPCRLGNLLNMNYWIYVSDIMKENKIVTDFQKMQIIHHYEQGLRKVAIGVGIFTIFMIIASQESISNAVQIERGPNPKSTLFLLNSLCRSSIKQLRKLPIMMIAWSLIYGLGSQYSKIRKLMLSLNKSNYTFEEVENNFKAQKLDFILMSVFSLISIALATFHQNKTSNLTITFTMNIIGFLLSLIVILSLVLPSNDAINDIQFLSNIMVMIQALFQSFIICAVLQIRKSNIPTIQIMSAVLAVKQGWALAIDYFSKVNKKQYIYLYFTFSVWVCTFVVLSCQESKAAQLPIQIDEPEEATALIQL